MRDDILCYKASNVARCSSFYDQRTNEETTDDASEAGRVSRRGNADDMDSSSGIASCMNGTLRRPTARVYYFTKRELFLSSYKKDQ